MKVLWVANVGAPYRIPVWERLGEMVDLEVCLLESNRTLARGHANRGEDWRVEVADRRTFKVRFLPTVRLSYGEGRYYLALRGFLRLLLGSDSILLGGWESPIYWQMLVLAKVARKRCVGFYESTLSSNRFSAGPVWWARRWFFRSLDAVVVPGVAAEEALLSFGVAPERIHRGFNAVDVELIHKAAVAERASPQGAGAPRGGDLVYIGQLIERKNVQMLIRSVSGIRDVPWKLSVVGQGPQVGELQLLVEELGIQGQVQFVGSVEYSDVPALLSRHATLVLPSLEEVWGLVVNEALAAGLHVVVGSDCGVATDVRDMEGVIIVDPTDQDSLRAALEESIRAWNGPISAPEILAATPSAFAATFARALGRASSAG